MAIRGRKPKPAEERLLTGNAGHRPIPATPDFAPGDHLAPPRRWKRTGYERQEWARIVPELQRIGVAKLVHQGALETICELFAAKVALYKEKDFSGARLQAAEYRKALNEFGLTAASAGRLGNLGAGLFTPPGHRADPEEEFFRRGPRLA